MKWLENVGIESSTKKGLVTLLVMFVDPTTVPLGGLLAHDWMTFVRGVFFSYER